MPGSAASTLFEHPHRPSDGVFGPEDARPGGASQVKEKSARGQYYADLSVIGQLLPIRVASANPGPVGVTTAMRRWRSGHARLLPGERVGGGGRYSKLPSVDLFSQMAFGLPTPSFDRRGIVVPSIPGWHMSAADSFTTSFCVARRFFEARSNCGNPVQPEYLWTSTAAPPA